jgi:hypothetical protein
MITYTQAIFKINPNAEFTYHNDDISNITWLNGTAPISIADIEAKKTELENAEQQAKAQKDADALAGNNKLLELGLTQAQVTAMTGYTPPVSE